MFQALMEAQGPQATNQTRESEPLFKSYVPTTHLTKVPF